MRNRPGHPPRSRQSARRPQSERGAIILVALCFAAVLAISLSSYLAISSQAMRLSNRSFQTDLSRQLAEAGLEQALAAFNANDWTGWTIAGTTASRTVTFASTKYGGVNVTGSFKLRVDNYNAFHLDATWVGGTSYQIGDLVGRNGLWYRCVQNHSSSQTPNGMANLEYWAPEPVGWKWRSNGSYANEAVVNYNGTWYRSTASSNNNTPTGAQWTSIGYLGPLQASHSNGDIIYFADNNTWYRRQGGWNNDSRISWQWENGNTYSFNDLVYRRASGSTFSWYRYINANPSSGNALTNSSYWENGISGAMWAWSATADYNPGDVVYRSGSWYRCLRAHDNQQPPNTTYWSNSPAGTSAWLTGRTYAVDSVVQHNGTWYRNTGSTTNTPPASPWISAATPTWNSATAYSAGNHVAYGGVWYRCLSAHTNQTPNHATYWTAVAAPVVYSEGIATLPDGPAVRTQLRANVAAAPLFPNALAATDTVSLGTTSLVDSYDSAAGTYAAQAAIANNPEIFKAVVAGTRSSGMQDSVVLSSATVKGYAAAPGSSSTPAVPKVAYAASAKLQNVDGTVTSPDSTATNVDLTRISRSPYIPQLSIQTVVGGTELPDDNGITLGTPGATTPSVYFFDGDLDMNNASENITINGPVVLTIDGYLRIRSSTSARIRITATGSLRLHVARDLRLESSGGGIDNQTLDPKNLVVLLTRSGNDNFEISCPTQPFYGVVYLPNSGSNLSVADGVEVYGAISAQNVSLNGSASLHYDTSLRHFAVPGVEPAYVITDWRELGTSERATLP